MKQLIYLLAGQNGECEIISASTTSTFAATISSYSIKASKLHTKPMMFMIYYEAEYYCY